MNAQIIFFLFLFLFCVNNVSGYKYLGIFPFFAKSHYFLGNELMKGLARAGHEATILASHEEKNPPNDNYKQIVLEGLLEQQIDLIKGKDSQETFIPNPIKGLFKFMNALNIITELTLNHTTTQKMIKEKPKYDAVIITHFNLDALKALAPHFDAHQVIFFNHGASIWVNNLVGSPSLPSIDSVNPLIMMSVSGQMNFKQRLINTVFSIVQYVYNNAVLYPYHKELVQKYISKDLDLDKILYNVSFALYNSHVSMDRPAAEVPCVKNIAGFHVQPPKKLPETLQKYLDEAKDGVIYFSMGSHLKSADFPAETREAILKAFSKRKENILWKFENDDLPGKSANVRIEKWLPQTDILAHPNVKLFITHGGLLSLIETVYNGVPTISIPVIADQLKNAKMAESHGYTKIVDLNSLSEEVFSAAIEEVISNVTYRLNAKTRSEVFHDRAMHPMKEAVHWMEYVVKHSGAHHLRMDHIELTWYQYYLLDVIGTISIVVFLVFFIPIKIFSFLVGKCFKNRVKSESKKIKKQ